MERVREIKSKRCSQVLAEPGCPSPPPRGWTFWKGMVAGTEQSGTVGAGYPAVQDTVTFLPKIPALVEKLGEMIRVVCGINLITMVIMTMIMAITAIRALTAHQVLCKASGMQRIPNPHKILMGYV